MAVQALRKLGKEISNGLKILLKKWLGDSVLGLIKHMLEQSTFLHLELR